MQRVARFGLGNRPSNGRLAAGIDTWLRLPPPAPARFQRAENRVPSNLTPSPWAVENVGFQVMSILPGFVARTAGKGYLASACVSIAVSGQGVADTRF